MFILFFVKSLHASVIIYFHFLMHLPLFITSPVLIYSNIMHIYDILHITRLQNIQKRVSFLIRFTNNNFDFSHYLKYIYILNIKYY